MDEHAVGHAVLAYRRVDALDPQRPERALAELAAPVLVLHRLFDRLLGNADRILAPAIIAFGSFQNFLMLGMSGYTALDACHGSLRR